MQVSYTSNYLKIYFFQALSIILGFVSLFVVVPSISSNAEIYGVYTVCTSITVFLSYADLGFLSAGNKFASEYYAKGERENELNTIGFVHFILLLVVLFISLCFLFLSFKPELLIKDIDSSGDYSIAKQLLLILAVFSPVMVMQRMLQMVYMVRLQNYKIQRVAILGNILKIASAFYFFSDNRYDIVGYYLCFNIISLMVAVINAVQAKVAFDISIFDLFRRFRFSRDIYDIVKGLAFSSLFATVEWIVFYEIDLIVIGKFLGAEAVAIYAIGFTILGFIRSLLGVFFSPFEARFNHIIAQGDEANLKGFFLNIIGASFPIVVFPLLAIAIMSPSITISWVGSTYSQSIIVVALLACCNIFAFVSYPTSIMFVAKQELRRLYLSNAMMPIIYWTGVILCIQYIGVYSFGLFKLLTFVCMGLYYLHYSLRMLSLNVWDFFRGIVLPNLPGILVLSLLLAPINSIFTNDKSIHDLLFTALIMLGALLCAIGVTFCSSRTFQAMIKKVINSILKK